MDSITHTELVIALAKPGADIVASLTAEQAHLMHMAIGFSGETPELIQALEKNDMIEVLEELGDVEFYLEGARQGVGAILHFPEKHSGPADTLVDLVYLAGELLDAVKRVVIYEDCSKMSLIGPILQKIRTALGGIYELTGFTYEQAVRDNILKLSKRYRDLSYSDKAAVERADKNVV